MKRGKEVSVCIIGAGPSGITAAKHVLQVGINNLVVYDRNDQVGGNWVYSDEVGHSSVYEAAHIISSKRWSQYHDFPMPDDYPDYPGHLLMKEYFQDYADHFGINDFIQFNTEVVSTTRNEDESWNITLGDGTTRKFDYLIVANGHHWNPRYPNYPGEFNGEFMHSHEYKTHIPFRGKRVLVIGGGNSGCDITVDVSRHASFTGMSWRRGYHVLPKLIFGKPPDVINAKMRWLPDRLVKFGFKITMRILVGKYTDYGLPKPDHQLLSTHPITNTHLLNLLRHGKIHPRRDIERFDGKKVHFKDGLIEEYDTIIAATGYKISFPFMEEEKLNLTNLSVPLYLKMFTPKLPSLAIIGLLQPQGCIWPLSDTQSQIFANYMVGNYEFPEKIEKEISKEVHEISKKYVASPRHSTEVDYHKFQKKLFKQVPRNAPTWNG